MAKGNEIVLTPEQPRVKEGKVTGALLPGTFVQIDTSEGMDDQGRFTYEQFGGGARAGRHIGILLPDALQGATATTAYVTGSRCFVYILEAGDEINVLAAGTGAFGDVQLIDNAGKAAAGAVADHVSVQLLETAAADTLTFAIYTGD